MNHWDDALRDFEKALAYASKARKPNTKEINAVNDLIGQVYFYRARDEYNHSKLPSA